MFNDKIFIIKWIKMFAKEAAILEKIPSISGDWTLYLPLIDQYRIHTAMHAAPPKKIK